MKLEERYNNLLEILNCIKFKITEGKHSGFVGHIVSYNPREKYSIILEDKNFKWKAVMPAEITFEKLM